MVAIASLPQIATSEPQDRERFGPKIAPEIFAVATLEANRFAPVVAPLDRSQDRSLDRSQDFFHKTFLLVEHVVVRRFSRFSELNET